MAPSSGLTVVLTLGGGILLGSWSGHVWGIAVGALLGYLLAQRQRLSTQVDALRQHLVVLEVQLRATGTRADAGQRAAPPVPARTDAPPSTRVSGGSHRPAPPSPAPARAPTPDPAPAPPAPSTPIAPGRLDQAIEQSIAWLKRGNPVAKVGIVILFIGAAFLAKYAADHSLLPLELRLAALAAGAVALLVIGWRLRGSRALYAQILQGGGVGGLYLVVFAAARLYHLLPHALALPLLIAVATAAALLAVAQNSLALAVIGTAGGFLAPVLLSTGGGSHVALFTYYAVLNAGIFTVAWFRAWRTLNLVGFFFTFGITAAWRATAYQPDDLASADFFLLLFFLMYVGISVLFALRQKPELRGYVSGSLVFGLPVAAFTLQATLVSRIEYGLAFSALGFGAFYLGLAWTLFRTRLENLGLLAEAFAALGVIFGSLAVPLAFDHQTTAAMWSVEGAGLLWLGVRQRRRLARAFGLLLQLAGGIGYLIGLHGFSVDIPVLNTACIGALLLAGSGALSARWLQRHAAELAGSERGIDFGALTWAAGWFLYGGLAEIGRSVPPQADYGAGVAWGGVVLVALALARRRWSWTAPARLAAALAPALAIAGLLSALGRHPFMEGGLAGWIVALTALVVLLRTLDLPPEEPSRRWLHAGGLALLAILAAWDGSWHLGRLVAGVWRELPWAVAPMALLWLANRQDPWPTWPLQTHRDTYQWLASLPLALWCAAWLLALNLGNAGDPGGLPYLPLLNPLDLVSAAVLATLGWWVTGLPEARRAAFRHRAAYAAAAGLAFVWLNAALVRALHYGVDTPLDFHGVRHSVQVQASLSIFWTLLGLSVMFLSTRRGWRQAWLAGAGLMGVVVLKLFLVDLEGSGSIARIASFMSVGALMLVAGYLSPLPPDAAREKDKEAA